MSGGGGSKSSSTIKDTPEQRELASVAADQWNYAQQNLAPLENAYMESIGRMTSPGNMAYLAGRTLQGQQQAVAGASQQYAQQTAPAGVDPSSGRFQAGLQGISLAGAASGGDTLGRAQHEQENQQVMGLQNVVAIGQGQAGQAQVGLSGLAQQSAADVQQAAVNRFTRKNANAQLLGQIGGAAAAHGLSSSPSMAPGGGVAAPGYTVGQGLNLYGNTMGAPA